MSGNLLSESAIIEELFSEILESLIDLYDIFFSGSVLILVSDDKLSLLFGNESMNPLTVLNDFSYDFSTELHFVDDLNGSNFKVVFLFVLIFDC